MRRWLSAALLLAAILAPAANAQRRGRGGPAGAGGGFADPSDIIAAEMAMTRLSAEKGRWKALGESSTKDAVMFAPGATFVRPWLKTRAGTAPPPAVKRSIHSVFISCDGSAAISNGAWSGPQGSSGWYTTVWRRDARHGGYKWVLAQDAALTRPFDPSEAIIARTAACPKPGKGPGAGAPGGSPDRSSAKPAALTILSDAGKAPPADYADASADGTLRWRWGVTPDGAPSIDGWMAGETGEEHIVAEHMEPPRRSR